MSSRMYYAYILTNTLQSVLYIGVTNDIARRLHEHKTHAIPGFTDRYNVTKLVYVEEYAQVEDAIRREKQLKRWNRAKKEALINAKTRPGRKSPASEMMARFLDFAHFVRFARNDNKGHYASRTNDLSIVPFMLLKRTWLDLRYLRTP